MTLLELRDALQKATGPDYLIDAAILELTKGAKLEMIDGFRGIRWPDGRVEPTGYMPKFTYSIDAAVTLVEGLALWSIMPGFEAGAFEVELEFPNDPEQRFLVDAATPALALCLARATYELAKAQP